MSGFIKHFLREEYGTFDLSNNDEKADFLTGIQQWAGDFSLRTYHVGFYLLAIAIVVATCPVLRSRQSFWNSLLDAYAKKKEAQQVEPNEVISQIVQYSDHLFVLMTGPSTSLTSFSQQSRVRAILCHCHCTIDCLSYILFVVLSLACEPASQ